MYCLSLIQQALPAPTPVISNNFEIVEAWGPVAVGFAAIIASFISSYVVLRRQSAHNEAQLKLQREQHSDQLKINTRQLGLVRSKEERDEIVRKLNTFYGPFRQLRTQSRILYAKFAQELMPDYNEKHRHEDKRFRTLRYLVRGKKFEGADLVLLRQILHLGQKQIRLIESRSGVVDKPELQELLGKLAAHIRILRLASEGKLSAAEPQDYENIVFPLEVDGAIESAILRLQDRLTELSQFPGDQTPVRTSQDFDERTIDYYNQHADEYAVTSFSPEITNNVSHFQEELLKRLDRGARILDAGCGVGRDTRYFIKEGRIVIAFDASKEMVRRCREYPHAYCKQMTFAELQYNEEFDAVWACASLLHLRPDQAREAIRRLTTALKIGGVMYIALKLGEPSESGHDIDGRYFTYYTESSAKQLYENDKRLECISVTPSGKNKRGGPLFLNLFLRRASMS
jgi:ubiquinone/menaquinone biosynthesis C-methylase UbiE